MNGFGYLQYPKAGFHSMKGNLGCFLFFSLEPFGFRRAVRLSSAEIHRPSRALLPLPDSSWKKLVEVRFLICKVGS